MACRGGWLRSATKTTAANCLNPLLAQSECRRCVRRARACEYVMICAVSARVCLLMLRHPHRCRLCAHSQAGHDGVARSLARTQRSASTRRSRTQRCGQEHRLDNRSSVEYRPVVGGPASRGGGRRRLPHRCMGNRPLAPTAKPAHDRLPVAAARSSVDANPSPTNPKQRGPQSQPCSTRQYSVPSGGLAL